MRVAVISPYYREAQNVLEQCHRSVVDQTKTCDHFLIADGFPNPIVEGWRAKSFHLPFSHRDGGNLPRVIGSISAFNQGYEAVAFLDADNWFLPDHIERMVALHQRTGAAVCTAGRSMYRLDGSFMFDDDKNDGRGHVDTSCFFLTRAALPVIARWALIPRELADIVDTIYWGSIRSARLSHAHEKARTVCYRTPYEADYRRIGERLPVGGKTLDVTDKPVRWFKSLPADDRLRLSRVIGWPSRRRSIAALYAASILSRLPGVPQRRVLQ